MLRIAGTLHQLSIFGVNEPKFENELVQCNALARFVLASGNEQMHLVPLLVIFNHLAQSEGVRSFRIEECNCLPQWTLYSVVLAEEIRQAA